MKNPCECGEFYTSKYKGLHINGKQQEWRWSEIIFLVETIMFSARLAKQQALWRTIPGSSSRRPRHRGPKAPFQHMFARFTSRKDRQLSAGRDSRCISGSSVLARYSTLSSPPSYVTRFTAMEFWAIFITAKQAYCRTSISPHELRTISSFT